MDKHCAVLHFRVAIVPNNAALTHFDETAVDVVCVSLHYLFDLTNPIQILELDHLLPAFFVSRFEKEPRLSSQIEVVAVCAIVSAEPLFELSSSMAAKNHHCVSVVH